MLNVTIYGQTYTLYTEGDVYALLWALSLLERLAA